MGVCGCSWAGEPIAGDFGGDIVADFVGFLKNFDADLLGGAGCGEEGGGPFKVEEEKKRGCVVEDCGEGVSFWGSLGKEE